jgi:MOSC domain-containing protein YiiM
MEHPSPEGLVMAVASDTTHRFSKPLRSAIVMIEGLGVEGDAHAGAFVRHRYLSKRQPRLPNVRQVHLIPGELYETLRVAGYDIFPGDLGENVTTAGLELERFPLGTLLRLGAHAVIELTGLRTPCTLIDRFRKGLKKEMIRASGAPKLRCGVLGVVKATGEVASGDAAIAVVPPEPRQLLPAL